MKKIIILAVTAVFASIAIIASIIAAGSVAAVISAIFKKIKQG